MSEKKNYKVGLPSIIGGRVDTFVSGYHFNEKGVAFDFIEPNKDYGLNKPVPMLFTKFEALIMFSMFQLRPVELSDKTIKLQTGLNESDV